MRGVVWDGALQHVTSALSLRPIEHDKVTAPAAFTWRNPMDDMALGRALAQRYGRIADAIAALNAGHVTRALLDHNS